MLITAIFLSQKYNVLVLEKPQEEKAQTVNAVIGDISYKEVYGELPDESTSESKRIVTHLNYVRKKLGRRDVSHLPFRKQKKRSMHLQRLKNYIQRGEFPVNEAYPNQRRSNFIDSKGRICAVGYLIEQSLGREAAEGINGKYQYEYVLNMDSELLEGWAAKNGFTLRELAQL